MSRLLQTYPHEDLVVTFDARRCIHSGECLRRLPAVFDRNARPWVRPENAERDAIVNAVLNCPTGALRIAVNGAPVEITDDAVQVRAVRNGPLYIRGPVRVVDEDGTALVADARLALCRCGHSRRQPLCDGSHRDAGFRDPS